MASVLGFAEHLLQHGDEIVAEDRVSALQAIVRSAERVVRLAEDALLASALESGGVPVNLEPVIVIDAVREAFEPLEAMAEPHRFEAQIEPGLVVIADPHRLWQVLTNLLTNALKNSPPGTRVEIAADRCGESVEINVRDHGPGIAPELRDKLFERFSQLPGGEGTGSGLGLYICQQLLELIGGDISISDTTGTGSTFTIRLPAAEGA